MNERLILKIGLIIIIGTFAVFSPALYNQFVYDDEQYLLQNFHVRQGLTANGLVWSFKSMYAANWHPLTWMAHMVDCSIYGLKPWGHRLSNLLIHSANAFFLFILLVRLTGYVWRSAFVAALFAVHPLRLESVIWIAERKDVLSTLFFMLILLAYARYVKFPTTCTYILMIVLYVLGLMSKPMLVTLPLVLLLLDFWPIGRMGFIGSSSLNCFPSKIRGLLIEKIPLFILALASGVVTFVAQKSGGAMSVLNVSSLPSRILNAFLSYIGYLFHMFWPARLAIYYPYPELKQLTWKGILSGLFIIAITALAFRTARKHPYLVFGWFWYLLTLIPVIGIIQVGGQAMADRYTYIPLIGIFVVVAWGVPSLFEFAGVNGKLAANRNEKLPLHAFRRYSVLPITGGLCLIAFMISTLIQIGYWRNNITLFSRALQISHRNYFALNALGLALAKKERHDQAIPFYRKALEIAPRYFDAYINLGISLEAKGRLQEAFEQYMLALKINPKSAIVHNNLGVVFAKMGNSSQAKDEFEKAIQLDPTYAAAQRNLKRLLRSLVGGSATTAEDYYRMGLAFLDQGKLEGAVDQFRKAVQLKPNHSGAWNALGMTLSKLGRLKEAEVCYNKVLEIEPNRPEPHEGLALVLYLQGKYSNAWQEVMLCRKYGGAPNPNLVKLLEAKLLKP
ncbi:MAG: tetratricopeptide repeat protein [Armatimonadetes bacterium]|nr:tetratricopeptide repeat protein [Armatimonadota bacterium]